MDKDTAKEGISVQELESFAKKYTNEGFIILAVLIATISSMLDFFTGPMWTIGFAGLAAIVSIAFPEHVLKFHKPVFSFILKQQKPIQMVIGVVRIVLAIFIPFVIFAEIGLLAGIGIHYIAKELRGEEEKEPEEPRSSEEEEHI